MLKVFAALCAIVIAVPVFLAGVLAISVYFVWAYSFVVLKGYEWFLYDVFKHDLNQVQVAAALMIALSVLSVSRMSAETNTNNKTVTGSALETRFVSYLIGPWITLGMLYLLTLL